jgi:RNA recognition motif-containing protein
MKPEDSLFHSIFRSKGFGFVIFKDAESVDEVQKMENGHFIDSKEVETRRAVQRKGKQEKV